MLCPECFAEMTVVDATGEGDPCWECPGCKYVMDYDPSEDRAVWDSGDDVRDVNIDA